MKSMILFTLCLLFISSAFSFSPYADITITIDSAGVVTIDGDTNTPDILEENSQNYTSKKQQYWLFNYTTDYYDNFVYSIILPKHSSINYIKVPELSRFEDSSDGLTITGATQNRSSQFLVQYSIDRPNNVQSYTGISVIIVITFFIVFISLFLYKKRKKRSHNFKLLTYTLTPRQKTIIHLLKKNNGRMTQKELEKQTGFVKSSLSRNIDSLVRQNMIVKEKTGMSNIIIFRPVPPNSAKE